MPKKHHSYLPSDGHTITVRLTMPQMGHLHEVCVGDLTRSDYLRKLIDADILRKSSDEQQILDELHHHLDRAMGLISKLR